MNEIAKLSDVLQAEARLEFQQKDIEHIVERLQYQQAEIFDLEDRLDQFRSLVWAFFVVLIIQGISIITLFTR
jgi:uncharacterized membrane protein (DUF106 family)